MWSELKLKYVGLLVCLTAILGACSKDEVDTTEIYSTDKEVALRIEVNWGGGPAAADMTTVYVFLPNSPGARKRTIFKGSAMSHFSASWRGARVIEVSYKDGYVSECDPTAELSAGTQVSVVGCKPGRVGPYLWAVAEIRFAIRSIF
jgi:hypothetical protein